LPRTVTTRPRSRSMFIQHTVACAQCRTEGMDCVAAGELRQEYRAAKERAKQPR
jgi:hypothetical protein